MANNNTTKMPLLLLSLSLVLIIIISPTTSAKLTPNYYSKSCPQVEDVIRDVIIDKQIASPTTAAATLRLFFHDCFVGGCDASTLVSTNRYNHAERDADINLSLPGDAFDAVVRAKSHLELQCPGVVSCSDVLALATRDLVSMLGGPHFRVPLGRRDSLDSTSASVGGNLPLPNMTVPELAESFGSKGFTVRELVALSGAHTVGFTHCKEFAGRIYGYGRGAREDSFDPSMNPRFARGLQSACRDYEADPTIATFNDIMTPSKFDNMYFKNVERGLVLLGSDQALLYDPRTAPIVKEYAANETAFFGDFAAAMEKLGAYGVKTEKEGEVRRRCDAFNNIDTSKY